MRTCGRHSGRLGSQEDIVRIYYSIAGYRQDGEKTVQGFLLSDPTRERCFEIRYDCVRREWKLERTPQGNGKG